MSSNDNPLYLDFWPIVSKLWKLKFNIEPVLLYFGPNHNNISTEYGTVVNMEILDGIPISTQAQCSRLWYLGQLKDTDISITSDIDMLPLSKKYFIESIEPISNNKLVNLNPIVTNFIHLPMCYNIGSSLTFKKILNLDISWLDFMNRLIDWSKTTECKDYHGVGILWSLDETWSTNQIINYEKENKGSITLILRPNGVNGFRIDRPNWRYNKSLLKDDYYYDAHSVRPYSQYKQTIDEIITNSMQGS